MWIERDFERFFANERALPVRRCDGRLADGEQPRLGIVEGNIEHGSGGPRPHDPVAERRFAALARTDQDADGQRPFGRKETLEIAFKPHAWQFYVFNGK